MTQWDKLIEQVLQLSDGLRFEEVRKILECLGYEMRMPRNGSSHCVFRQEGCKPVCIPKKSPVKRLYVEQLKRAIEERGARR